MKSIPDFLVKQPRLPLWVLLRELQISQEELSKATDGALTRAAIAKWMSGASPAHPVIVCYLTAFCRLKIADFHRWVSLPRLEMEGLLGKSLDDGWYSLVKAQLKLCEQLLQEQERLNEAHPAALADVEDAFKKSEASSVELWAKTDPQKLLRDFRRKQGEQRQAEKTKNQQKRER